MENQIIEYLILGAGPAGLQLAHHLQEAGRDYEVLEAETGPGHFFRTFPRHRTLISINKVHTGFADREKNLRFDWNSLLADTGPSFTEYSREFFPPADSLLDYLRDYAQSHSLSIRYETRIEEISRVEGIFALRDARGVTHRCRRLIVATGLPLAYTPEFPGCEHVSWYPEMSVDPEDFVGARVLILGKGNSAFETADHLMAVTATTHLMSPHSLKLAWQTHFVGHLRAINNNLLDTYLLKSQNAIIDGQIIRIDPHPDEGFAVTFHYNRVAGDPVVVHYDHVLGCTGFRFDASIFAAECQPELMIDDRFPAQTSAWESANVPDLYFAGTLMQARDYKRHTSAFIHGFRYNVRTLARLLGARYHDELLPHRSLTPTAEVIASAILERVDCSSALWQQFGFLVDVVLLPGPGLDARYIEELPRDYVLERRLEPLARVFGVGPVRALMISLEYGDTAGHDPLALPRPDHRDVAAAAASTFLHPVIRCCVAGEIIAEHHVIENLETDWTDDELHRKPLERFLAPLLEDHARPLTVPLLP